MSFSLGIILIIPRNINLVINIEKFILLFQNQTLNSFKLILFYETLKIARIVIASKIILSYIDRDLLTVNI